MHLTKRQVQGCQLLNNKIEDSKFSCTHSNKLTFFCCMTLMKLLLILQSQPSSTPSVEQPLITCNNMFVVLHLPSRGWKPQIANSLELLIVAYRKHSAKEQWSAIYIRRTSSFFSFALHFLYLLMLCHY